MTIYAEPRRETEPEAPPAPKFYAEVLRDVFGERLGTVLYQRLKLGDGEELAKIAVDLMNSPCD
jgi:hypothetical protein